MKFVRKYPLDWLWECLPAKMSRVQAWLEAFLTPLSKLYGNFEYTKDSNDVLMDFLNLNTVAESEAWDFSDIMLFGIDVKALYTSIKFEYLKLALNDLIVLINVLIGPLK